MDRFDPSIAPELIRAARVDADLTQAELAERAGLRQPSLAQMERGVRAVSADMLERVLRAADYRPSLPLAAHADEIRVLATSRGLTAVRIFGSTVRGLDGFGSDVDILVTPGAESDLFDLALFGEQVSRLIGFPVDVIADTSPGAAVIAREAVPL